MGWREERKAEAMTRIGCEECGFEEYRVSWDKQGIKNLIHDHMRNTGHVRVYNFGSRIFAVSKKVDATHRWYGRVVNTMVYGIGGFAALVAAAIIGAYANSLVVGVVSFAVFIGLYTVFLIKVRRWFYNSRFNAARHGPFSTMRRDGEEEEDRQ